MSEEIRKPNVIYILADDMGYGDIRYLNPECKFPTPHLDRLGREGMAFRDAHSSSSVCTPSRYSILTGRYCWRTYLKNGVIGGIDTSIIEKGRKTVAQLFKDSGYTTACIGKWHLGWEWAVKEGHDLKKEKKHWREDKAEWIDFSKPVKNGPCEFGFDHFYGIAGSLDMPPYVYLENDRVEMEPTCWGSKMEFLREGPRQHDLRANNVLGHTTERAVSFIHQQKKDNPFFLYFPLTAPHSPISPSPEFDGKSGINPYADFCMEVDFRVGQILHALEQKGLSENTMVIYTTDNGASQVPSECEMLEERYGHHSNYIYRGYKSDIWDGGHRLPFLVRWPEKIQPSTFCDEAMGLFDFYATIGDLLGITLEDHEGEDSVSFLPAFDQRSIPSKGREAIVHHSFDGRFAIRKGDWKLCFCPGSGGWTSPTDKEAVNSSDIQFQLYDLGKDPSEENNLLGQYQEVEKELKCLLKTYVMKGRSTEGLPQENDSAIPIENWEQLSFLPEIPERYVIDD